MKQTRYKKIDITRTPDEKDKLIDQSLKLSRPKFRSRIYYSLILIFGVLLLVMLGDLPTEAVVAVIILAVAAFAALWISYAVKMKKYKKWYDEQYLYLQTLEH